MAGAISGAMHGASVITEAERAQLDTANRLALGRSAATFAATATEILAADAARAQHVAAARATLGLHEPPSAAAVPV